MRKPLTLFVLLPCLVFSLAGKKDKPKKEKKNKGPKVEQVGWAEVGDGKCYFPPAFESMPDGPRRLARINTLEAYFQQWRGERDDGVKFDDTLVKNLDAVLLSDPKDVEAIGQENLEYCKKFFSGEGDAAWQSWATGLPARLTVGECSGSLLPNQMHDYLTLGTDWHMEFRFCKGDEVQITGSDRDYYQLDPKGPWINVDGDPNQKAPEGAPCPSCPAGQLLLRFQSNDKTIDEIKPVGTGVVYKVPAHGKISVRINDTSSGDNVWKVEGGMSHHTGITYEGAK